MICDPKTYGINLGPATLVSIAIHKGSHYWQLKTPRQQLDIKLTPTGLIRVGSPETRTEYPKAE